MTRDSDSPPTDYGNQFLIALQAVETALANDESLAKVARGDLNYVIGEILVDASDELRKDVFVYLSCTAKCGN